MHTRRWLLAGGAAAAVALALVAPGTASQPDRRDFDREIRDHAVEAWTRGRQIFREDTFGDEAFWGGALKLHQAIAGQANRRRRPRPQSGRGAGRRLEGGRGRAVATHPAGVRHGRVNLDDPAVTLALLDANAVVGREGLPRAGRRSGVGRHPVRVLPFHGGRRVRAGDRASARRLAQPRSERRRDRRAGPRLERRHRPAGRRRGHRAQGARQLGPRPVRRAPVPRRQALPPRRPHCRRRSFRRRSGWPA